MHACTYEYVWDPFAQRASHIIRKHTKTLFLKVTTKRSLMRTGKHHLATTNSQPVRAKNVITCFLLLGASGVDAWGWVVKAYCKKQHAAPSSDVLHPAAVRMKHQELTEVLQISGETLVSMQVHERFVHIPTLILFATDPGRARGQCPATASPTCPLHRVISCQSWIDASACWTDHARFSAFS